MNKIDMVHPPREPQDFSKEASRLREDGDQLRVLMAAHLNGAPSAESRIAWREYMRVHSELSLLEAAIASSVENMAGVQSEPPTKPQCIIQESQRVLAEGFSIADILQLVFSRNTAFRQVGLLMLSMTISILCLHGREAEAQVIVQQVAELSTRSEYRTEVPKQSKEPEAQVLKVEDGRVLASVPHPNPRYGRFRYLFEKDEIPTHMLQSLKRGCTLDVDFALDAGGRLKAVMVKGFQPCATDVKEEPKLEGGEYEDMAGMRRDVAKLLPRYAGVLDEARRRQEQQPPS